MKHITQIQIYMIRYFIMPKSKQLIILAGAVLLIAGIFVWKQHDIGENSYVAHERHSDDSATGVKKNRPLHDSGSYQSEVMTEAKTLAIPPGSSPLINEVVNVEDGQELNQRVIAEEDAILAAGGVLARRPKMSAPAPLSRSVRLNSISAKDWDGKVNLFVVELRAGKGFEVRLDQVEIFLSGKDLYGWEEGHRNWIGDEMMTMLRQEMPAKAYEIFREIQADATAPDAMRDYSIQHISHLIADSHVGQEGAELIRAAYESGNTVLASTALISLHRLSEKTPEFVKAEDVKRYAQDSVNSSDERLKATAQAILNESK